MVKFGQTLTSEMVKQAALNCGADACGIGSMDRFANAPKENDPRYLFPEAKSCIGLIFRVHRGLYRPMEEGTHWGMYSSVGYANVNDVHMPVVMRELGSFIEDFGYEAVIYNNTAVRYNINSGVPVREGYPKSNIFLHARIAGVICGLGEIGWSNIFLHPEFGPRVRLAFIFTDAELEPDPIMEPHLCDKCKICVAKCSSGAIAKDESVSFTVEGKTYSYAKLDEEKCEVGFQCGTEDRNPFLWDGSDETELVRFLMKAIYNDDSKYLKQRQIHSRWASRDNIYRMHAPSAAGINNFKHPGTMCGAACQRECMIHLEQQGKLTGKFHNKFRIRKPWKLDTEKLLQEIYGDQSNVDHITDYGPKGN